MDNADLDDDVHMPVPTYDQISAVVNTLAHTYKYENIFNEMMRAHTIAFGRNNERSIANRVIFFAPGMDEPLIRDDYVLRTAGFYIDLLRRIPADTQERVQEMQDCIYRLIERIIEFRNELNNNQRGGKKSRRKNRKSRKSRKSRKQ